MRVEAAAALAPVLARYAIVVEGPLEAEVLARLATGGDRAVTLSQLARPFPASPDLARPDAVGVARTVVTRLLASGVVEPIAGGYRLTDPSLAGALRQALEQAPAATPGPRFVLTPPTASTAPAAAATPLPRPEEASRLLQASLAVRGVLGRPAPSTSVGAAGTAPFVSAAAAGGGLGAAPSSSQEWPLSALLAPGGASAPRPTSPPPAAAPTEPTWGQGDAAVARASADVIRGQVTAHRSRVPLVADRSLVPALAVLAGEDALPPVLVVDLRIAVSLGTAPGLRPDALAAAAAGAAGTPPPWRRRRTATGSHGVRSRATLLEILFGAQVAEELDEDVEAPAAPPPPASRDGVVVTARTDDPPAEALAELLGVEVLLLSRGDDLGEEVLAYLDDGEDSVLLAPTV